MSKRKPSKLKAMAAAGNPWAIKTLREAQELGRAAALRGIAMQRAKRAGIAIAKAAPVYEPIRIEFAEPIAGLTLRTAHAVGYLARDGRLVRRLADCLQPSVGKAYL